MKPVLVEIIIPMVTAMGYNCPRCTPLFEDLGLNHKYRELCADEFPPDCKVDLERIVSWAEQAKSLYKHRLRIRIIDAASPLGMWKRIRHWCLPMPVFIVEGQRTHTGWDLSRMESIIDEFIEDAAGRLRKQHTNGYGS
jgi:hypothetical protein